MKLENTESIFSELAELVAESQADELEVKHKLPMAREEYIKQKTLSLIADLEKEHKKTLKSMEEARKILLADLENLPEVEREHHAKELLIAMDRLSRNVEMEQVTAATSWQKFLGLSNETLIWIYKLGFQFFEHKDNEKALSLFLMLAMLNPLVSDYWIALGFAQKGLSLEAAAINSFSSASFLNSDNPTPIYQSAEIYLHLGEFDKALLELEALAEIIERQKLDALKPQFELLFNKTKNKQTS
ncbi:MAG: hypothetical protein V4489_05655 [Chlamydiota bacterium]